MATDEKNVKIETVAYGGDGISKVDGLVYFVKNALPGQTVSLKNIKKKKKFVQAEVSEVLENGANYRASQCTYSDECGGCQWWNLNDEKQNNLKKEFVEDAFLRIAKIDKYPEINFHPSPKTQNYRQRIRLKCEVDKNGSFKLGYYKGQSHEIVDIKTCKIADPTINLFLNATKEWSFRRGSPFKAEFDIQSAIASKDHQDGLLVTIHPSGHLSKDVTEDIKFKCANVSEVIHCQFGIHSIETFFVYDRQFDIDYFTAPGTFHQVNPEANRILREILTDKVSALKSVNILDLYCGSGNLSAALSHQETVQSVTGYEYNHESVAAGIKTIKSNNIENTTYIAGHVLAKLKDANWSQTPDLVLVDPPRAGVESEALQLILDLSPKDIIYISCDPTTLARDLKEILKNEYVIKSVDVFDFFPQTYHVESVVHLSR